MADLLVGRGDRLSGGCVCVGDITCGQSRQEGRELQTRQTLGFAEVETKAGFLYPVFVGHSRRFVVELNSCFVLAQEKSIERRDWNNPSQTVRSNR